MYIKLIYRIRKDEHATHGDVVQNNLQTDGTEFRNVAYLYTE